MYDHSMAPNYARFTYLRSRVLRLGKDSSANKPDSPAPSPAVPDPAAMLPLDSLRRRFDNIAARAFTRTTSYECKNVQTSRGKGNAAIATSWSRLCTGYAICTDCTTIAVQVSMLVAHTTASILLVAASHTRKQPAYKLEIFALSKVAILRRF